MAEYYFLTTLFPPVDPDIPLELSVRDLLVLYRDNLQEKDWESIAKLLRETDLNNLRAFFSERNFFDSRGSLTKEELEEVLTGNNGLPPYVHDFLSKHEHAPDREKRFEELLSSYYREEVRVSQKGWMFPKSDFVVDWLQFERGLRLTLAAMRAKQQNKDLTEVFLFEDPEDDQVQYLLAQKDALEIEPPEAFHELKTIMKEDDPLQAARKLLDFRLEELRRLVGLDPFSLRRVLAYFVEVFLVENWQRLSRETGKQILERIVR